MLYIQIQYMILLSALLKKPVVEVELRKHE